MDDEERQFMIIDRDTGVIIDSRNEEVVAEIIDK